jgi:DNA segregation ATPase FtsK/SpoIIIE, S-DNA-T family
VRFLYDDGRHVAELDLEVRVPDATVADLAEALGQPPGSLIIGRLHLPGDLSLDEAGFHEGAVVRPAGSPAACPDRSAEVEVVVVGGLAAGARHRLPAGSFTVGRDAANDVVVDHPTVSARHCTLTVAPGGLVTITDLASHNGTWVDDVAVTGTVRLAPTSLVRIGAALLRVAPPAADDRSLAVDPLRHISSSGSIPFNRPPRPAPPPEEPALTPPAAPTASTKPSPFSIAGIVAPILMGAVMVAVLKNPMFALFMLLSPVMAVGTWLEGRRRSKKAKASSSKDFRAALAAFEAQLIDANERAGQRRWETSPDPAEVLRRAAGPSVRVWERRPGHPDFLQLHAGTGDLPWEPSLSRIPGERPPEVDAVLAARATLVRVPVDVDLADGGVVGLVGDRSAALALARSLLCQAATQSGPADLTVVVCCDADRVDDWDWAKWLPHTRDPGGGGDSRLLTADRDAADILLRTLAGRDPEAAGQRVTVCVLDAEGITSGRNAPARSVLRGDGGPAAGIIVATSPDELPALCTSVVELLGAEGEARLRRPQRGEVVEGFLVAGLTDAAARTGARALAPYEDPELSITGAGLPSAVSLVTLLGVDPFDADALVTGWRARGADPGLVAPIGMGESGPFRLDLVDDGPHGLIGGTTGSGKSELLRSLVAALATTTDPDHLTFVLIDYKGGAAFDECARLPHTVGLVTDLDEHLGERALRCLEAELRHRERRLRRSGATDLTEYLHVPASADEPLPRLVVVIDEFATMKAELPDFVEALVGIAQRGRSLGVHLLLATQRPSGAVSENIKANTNLRIALRVQDTADSSDIIGGGDAAAIARGQAGRAYVRLGPGEVVPIQTALVTGHTDEAASGAVDIAPFRFGRRARVAAARIGGGAGPSDLGRLVDAVRLAFDKSGAAAPRRPWPEPLPAVIDLDAIDDADGVGRGIVPVAVADDPDRQSQESSGWDSREGNLLLVGISGSGVTTTLGSIALTIARHQPPDRLHLYVLDLGAGELAPLADLPHTGAVVGASERERQQRLVRWLRAELDRRRAQPDGGRAEPEIVVLVDGYGSFAAEADDLAAMAMVDAFKLVVSDGPGVGIRTVIGADRVGAVPSAFVSTIAQKWLFRLADRSDYASFGVPPRSVPNPRPGQALVAPEGRVIQVGRPSAGLAGAVASVLAATEAVGRLPVGVGQLPDEVEASSVAGEVRVASSPWFLPLGIGSEALLPVGFTFYEGEHALIGGPPRSGRTTALLTVAGLVRSADPSIGLVGLAPRRSPLFAAGVVDVVVEEADAAVDAVGATDRAWVLLIDDVERVGDPGGALEQLVLSARPGLHVVAAGRTDTLRQAYGHWTRSVRRSRIGVLLQPSPELDGDLLGTTLPRRSPVAMRPGRGWLVHGGELEVVQLARSRTGDIP